MDAVREFSDEMAETQSAGDLYAGLTRCGEGLGFAYITYLAVSVPGQDRPDGSFPFLVSSYPPGWVARYQRKNFLRADPVVLNAMTKLRPLVWGGEDGLGSLDRKQRRVLGEAREYGIHGGVTVPVHGPGSELGLLTVARDHGGRTVRQAGPALMQALLEIGLQTHMAVTRRLMTRTPPAHRGLTDQERHCLEWTARGKTSWEISVILGRAEATVNFHLKNAVAKLNARNKCSAAAKAVAHGLIDL